MKISKDETQQFQNGATCLVHMYTFPSSKLGLVTAEISGRYPENGKIMNEVSDETYFVSSGSCTIHHETGDFSLGEGDVFFFPKGKWWWVEAEQLNIVVCTAPPCEKEQHQHLT